MCVFKAGTTVWTSFSLGRYFQQEGRGREGRGDQTSNEALQRGGGYVHSSQTGLFSAVSSLGFRSCGYPRMLLLLLPVLVREFESHFDEMLIFAKIKKKDQSLRASSVGGRNSTRVDDGRKGSSLLRIKVQGTNLINSRY